MKIIQHKYNVKTRKQLSTSFLGLKSLLSNGIPSYTLTSISALFLNPDTANCGVTMNSSFVVPLLPTFVKPESCYTQQISFISFIPKRKSYSYIFFAWMLSVINFGYATNRENVLCSDDSSS